MTAPSSRNSPSAAAVFTAGMLSLAAAMGIGRFCFTPLLPLMIGAGQLDVAGGGWIAAANYAGYLVGAVTAARLGLSATRLAAIALLLTALLTASMALVSQVPAWTAIRFAAGVCSAWAFVSTTVWCLGALARLQRPTLGTAIYSGVGTGIALSGLYCLVASSLGVSANSLWIQLGVLGAVLSVPAWLVVSRVEAPMLAASVPGQVAQTPAGLRGLVACYAIFGFGYILPATFLPVLARSVVDDPRLFGLAWPVFGTTAVVSIFVAGWFLRRASRMRVWAVSSAVMGVGVLLPSLWLSGWSIALSALFVGGTFMIITVAGMQEIRARATGDPTRLVARMTSGFAAGQIAGPVASSLLLYVPAFREHGLNLALQAGAALLLVAAVWLWRETAPSSSTSIP